MDEEAHKLIEKRKSMIDDRVYLAVPFEKKDLAKSKNAKWDMENKCWFALSSSNTELISLFAPRNIETQVAYKEKAKLVEK